MKNKLLSGITLRYSCGLHHRAMSRTSKNHPTRRKPLHLITQSDPIKKKFSRLPPINLIHLLHLAILPLEGPFGKSRHEHALWLFSTPPHYNTVHTVFEQREKRKLEKGGIFCSKEI